MDWIIKTENLSKDFKSGNMTVHALKNVSIEIKKAEILRDGPFWQE